MESEPSYVAWLSQYTERLKQMTEVELCEENHEDYFDESQTYADYLDYVDEWKWHAKEKVRELVSRFLHIGGNKHLRMQCTCKQVHVLTTIKEPTLGDVVVDSTATISMSCWYKTIASKANAAAKHIRTHSQRLADPIEQQMHKIVRLQLANDGQTPILLPYDIYMAIWWGIDSDRPFALSMLKAIGKNEAKDMKALQRTLVPKVTRKEVLLDFPDSDHGLHALLDSVNTSDRGEIIKFINISRTKLNPAARRINETTLRRRIRNCEQCKNRVYQPALAYPGIYYAPPGGGKTTAQNLELLTGFDTDWIGVGLNWTHYSIILQKRIPIITNQPEIFIGSGVKIVGIVPKHIRKGLDGKPLDDQQRILRWGKDQWRNTCLIKSGKGEYLADYAVELMMLSMLQQMVANYAINKLPFYKNLQNTEWTRKFPTLLKRKEQEESGQRRTLLE